MRKFMMYVGTGLALALVFLMIPVIGMWLAFKVAAEAYMRRLRKINRPLHKRDNYMPEQQPRGATSDGWTPADEGD